MNIPLTAFEIDILNEAIPTQALSSPEHLHFALLDLVKREQGNFIGKRDFDGHDIKKAHTEAANNILKFLTDNRFYYEREGGALYATEKIKHLREQKTIQQYAVWEAHFREHEAEALHEIETRGYINEEQNPAEHSDKTWQNLASPDYNALQENNPNAPHVHHKSHQFESKPGEISNTRNKGNMRLYLALIVLLLIALFILSQQYK